MIAELDGKTAIVTGGAGAIGTAITQRLAKSGAAVVIADIHDDLGQQLATSICETGGRAIYVHCDVTNISDTKRMTEAVESEFKRIDILINNAGINVSSEERHPIHNFDDTMWKKIINVDLDGVYYCSKPVVKHMINNGGGRIVNIGSVVGLVPFRNQCAFAAAKAGLFNLTKAMALELAQHNILVNAVAPGSIIMDGTKKLFYADKEKAESLLSHIPLRRPGTCDEIASAVAFLCDEDSSYMTGSVTVVDGGWTCGYGRNW